MKLTIGAFTIEINLNNKLEGVTTEIKIKGIVSGAEIDTQIYYTPNSTVPVFVNLHIESVEKEKGDNA